MKKIISILIILAVASSILDAQSEKSEIIKKGFNFGPLPVVAFDQDRGFQYGALLNIYDFGDGSHYPQPRQQFYFEASAYTKGSQFFCITYDTKHLIPGIRVSLAATFNNETAMDFYGFNGYESYYDYEKINQGGYTPFYRISRKVPNLKGDVIGTIIPNKLYWEAGYHFSYYKIGAVDLDKVNKGKDEAEQFHGETLYEKYRRWGIIQPDEATGGYSSAVRLGLMYDTRNVEAAPSKGIWAEAHAILAPGFLGTSHPYYRYSATFRHYLPLKGEDLVFAYRLNYQGTIGETAPFYVLPYFTMVGLGFDRDGLGGYRTVRGMLRGRVQALDAAFFNAELRWKFVHFQFIKQNISLGLSAFCDGAIATRGNAMNYDKIGTYPDDYIDYMSSGSPEKMHLTAGAGFRFIMNRNFIVAIEYGMPFNKQDGKGSLYINTGYLF